MSKTLSIILATVSAVFTLGVAWSMQHYLLSQPEALEGWLAQYGWFAILIYVGIQATTIIIAPLGGIAAQIAIIGLYGPLIGSLLIYLVSTPSYLVNFWLARRFGKRLIIRLVGESAMEKINQYTDHLGVWVITLFRVQNGNYDFISYAAGLTQFKTKQFMHITIGFGLLAMTLQYLVFRFAPNLVTGLLIIQGVTMGLVMVITIWLYPKV